jgi:hypothetical protein
LDLARRGCEAADYRLHGDIFDNVCAVRVTRVTGSWRVLVYFPAEWEVAVFFIGRHDEKRGQDVYNAMAERLRLPRSTGIRGRKRPSCCEGMTEPPDSISLIERLETVTQLYG